MPKYLEKEYNLVYILECNLEQAEKYDLLIIEMKKGNLNEILKWVFGLYCRKRIPILAIIYDFSITDKLLLNKFGIRDYVDGHYDVQLIQNRLKYMIRRINWENTKINK